MPLALAAIAMPVQAAAPDRDAMEAARSLDVRADTLVTELEACRTVEADHCELARNEAARLALKYRTLGRELDLDARDADAEAVFRRQVVLFELFATGPSAGVNRRINVSESYTELAWSLINQFRLREAEPLLRQAIAIREQAGHEGMLLAAGYGNLANVVGAQGRFDEAAVLYRRAAGCSCRVASKGGSRSSSLARNMRRFWQVSPRH